MNECQAIALCHDLTAEANAENMCRSYMAIQAANHDQWAVKESDGDRTIQVWISPELSFTL